MEEDKEKIILELLQGKYSSLIAKAIGFLYNSNEPEKDAADIIQDLFSEVIQKKESYFDIFQSGWFDLKIYFRLRDKCIRKNKKNKKKIKVEIRIDNLNQLVSTIYEIIDENNPHTILERKEFAQFLSKFISELSPKQQIVYTLRSFNCFTFREISDLLTIPIATAKERYYRAFDILVMKLRDIYE